MTNVNKPNIDLKKEKSESLEDESYEDYKMRMKVENGLVRDYLKGRIIPNV